MNKGNLNKVIGDGNIVIPIYILKCYKKLNLTMDEFVFLMYLYNKQDNLDFNPEKIANDLNIDIMEVMGYIAVLTDKGYLTLDVLKTENNILEEVINLNNFYEKISTFLINSEAEAKVEDDILKYVEKELGRPLNSIEINTINGWLDNHIATSLIKEAVKIAIDSGVYTLKYIDKIILDWTSRGINSLEDLKNQEMASRDSNDLNIDYEIENWNWLDDEEEYITN